MEKFVIEGGYPLSGTVVPAGNKNAALPILAASLLTEEELVIGNVPRIRDVDAMLALLEDLGVSVMWRDEHEVVAARRPRSPSTTVDADLASRIRASFLLAGPLLARVGEAHMPSPGRRLHRAPAARSAPRRAARAGRAGRGRRAATRWARRTGCAPATSSWTRRA